MKTCFAVKLYKTVTRGSLWCLQEATIKRTVSRTYLVGKLTPYFTGLFNINLRYMRRSPTAALNEFVAPLAHVTPHPPRPSSCQYHNNVCWRVRTMQRFVIFFCCFSNVRARLRRAAVSLEEILVTYWSNSLFLLLLPFSVSVIRHLALYVACQ